MNTKKVAIFSALAVALIWATASAFSSPIVDVGDGQIDTIGSTTTIDIILDEAPNGFSGYNLTLSLSNPSIAEIVSVSFPAWATLYSNSTLPADSVWIKAADLMDQVGIGATNVNLATLTLRGDNQGTTDIIVTVTKMDDDSGYPINPSTDLGHLIVGPTPTPSPTPTPTPTPSPTPTPTPTPSPTTVSFNPVDIKTSVGSSATTTLTLNRAQNGLSGYNLTVSLSNPSIAEIVSVSFPAWATLHANSTLPADSVWIKAADLMDQVGVGAIDVNLATLTLRGDNPGTTDIIVTVTKMDDDNGYPINPSTTHGHLEVGEGGYFDTGQGTYPSIFGAHNGTIMPNQPINVSKMYTYPCAGTGGHSEYVAFYNATTGAEIANGTWNGYQGAGDYHYIVFEKSFVLEKDVTYNYTICTGSYPQIHHTPALQTANGWINCTEFIDANGRSYNNWIPAIRLE